VARDLDVLAVIAAGGVVGSLTRWGIASALPHRGGAYPWATFIENVTGCLLLGVLMWFVVEVWIVGRYVRPFLGVGVLGGYTTFSTFSVETTGLLRDGAVGTAALYVVGSVLAGLLAVRAGRVLAAAAVPRRRA
jgi:CrcB protein